MSDTQDPETPIAGGGTVPPTPLQDDSLQRELISSELTGRQSLILYGSILRQSSHVHVLACMHGLLSTHM